MLKIDGSGGEGGGQILRSALTLALVTGTPFRLVNVRANRAKPGIRRQHLTSLLAAARVGEAGIEGAELGSTEVVFRPETLRGGSYEFAIGTSGSTTLVAQTLLPALALAREPSVLSVRGGTHNPNAPTFDYLERAYLPLLARLGVQAEARLVSHGFHPSGGGEIELRITPGGLARLTLLERGALERRSVAVLLSKLGSSIAARELKTAGERLGLSSHELEVVQATPGAGPGNVVTATLESQHVTELFTAIGERHRPAEQVATEVVEAVKAYLAAGVPVGPHLADQLIGPLALGAGGQFRTMTPTPHLRSQVELVEAFGLARVRVTRETTDAFAVEVERT